MAGNRNILPNLIGTEQGSDEVSQNNIGQNYATLEETLRDLMAGNNGGSSSKANMDENRVTGGPPPAKPFPDAIAANANETRLNEVLINMYGFQSLTNVYNYIYLCLIIL